MKHMTFEQAQRNYDAQMPAEMSDDEQGLRWLIESAEETIGRAERAMAAGDLQAAIDLLRSAGAELAGADWSC